LGFDAGLFFTPAPTAAGSSSHRRPSRSARHADRPRSGTRLEQLFARSRMARV